MLYGKLYGTLSGVNDYQHYLEQERVAKHEQNNGATGHGGAYIFVEHLLATVVAAVMQHVVLHQVFGLYVWQEHVAHPLLGRQVVTYEEIVLVIAHFATLARTTRVEVRNAFEYGGERLHWTYAIEQDEEKDHSPKERHDYASDVGPARFDYF